MQNHVPNSTLSSGKAIESKGFELCSSPLSGDLGAGMPGSRVHPYPLQRSLGRASTLRSSASASCTQATESPCTGSGAPSPAIKSLTLKRSKTKRERTDLCATQTNPRPPTSKTPLAPCPGPRLVLGSSCPHALTRPSRDWAVSGSRVYPVFLQRALGGASVSPSLTSAPLHLRYETPPTSPRLRGAKQGP
jgi:hypothetical protein